jgi:GNAT superfamily N-acetyltransferase
MGFVEASQLRVYINGTKISLVAFLEIIYVAPEHRPQGIAAQLISAVAEWAPPRGCREFASGAPLENEFSQVFTRRSGSEKLSVSRCSARGFVEDDA